MSEFTVVVKKSHRERCSCERAENTHTHTLAHARRGERERERERARERRSERESERDEKTHAGATARAHSERGGCVFFCAPLLDTEKGRESE